MSAPRWPSPSVVDELFITTSLSPDSAPGPRPERARIVVTGGPDRGTAIELDAAEPAATLIGTSPACALRLSDPCVSRRHASVEVTDGGVRLRDLGSRNGTWISGMAVVEVLLPSSATFRVGDTTLCLEGGAGVAHVAPRDESFGKVVGASSEMRRLYPLCRKLASSQVPVVIEGETGTGKEVLAEAMHAASSRADGPFVVFDCTAVPPNLIESALFGHERGAFTGAVAARKGVFEQADGGTLLIDEVGDLDLALQPKLLRALQRQEIQRVGSDRWIKVNVRVLAATRRDLDREVQAGRFRDDLFFRLAVARVELPPLRRRRGDVSLLVRHFWATMEGDGVGPPPELLARLEDYAWPGNVRELENTVARFLALGEISVLKDELADARRASAPAGDLVRGVIDLDLPFPRAKQRVIEDFERRYVEGALARHGGNVARAAAASGIALRYFQFVRARRR